VSATVVPPGGGETIYDHPVGGIRLLAGTEHVVLSEIRLGPGNDGPAPHIHHTHSDGFYVLDGELTVRLGDEEQQLPAGGFVMMPPGVVHTVRNTSEADVTVLNIHAPGAGFDSYLRAGRDGDQATRDAFDQDPPPEDGGRTPTDAKVVAPGEGERLALGPTSSVFKATGDDPDGHYSLSEGTLAPGFPGPPAHIHRTFADSFYVLEGTLTLRVGDDLLEAPAGTCAVVPPETVHTFSNPSDGEVRILNLMAPGGFERYLREVVAASSPGAPPDPAVMGQIASRYDFEPV
jgi:mannose-6-phosphate isomerase-like protein (cupin superfamily)